MSLLASSLRTTTSPPVTLAAGKNFPHVIVSLEPSDVDGSPGPNRDVTRELRGLIVTQQNAIQAQIAAGDISLTWTAGAEFSVGSIVVSVPGSAPAARFTSATKPVLPSASYPAGATIFVDDDGVENHVSADGLLWLNPQGTES